MKKNTLFMKLLLASTTGLLTFLLASCGVLKQQDTCLTNSTLCPAIPGAIPNPVVTVLVNNYSTSGPPAILSVTSGNSYGNVPVGNSQNLTLTVTNTGGNPAVLGTITTTGLGLAAPFSLLGGTCSSLSTVAVTGSCTLVVTFAPSTLGVATGNVTVPYNNAYASETTVGTLTGTGSNPGLLTFSDNPSYSFTSTTVNTSSAAKTFTVTNSGQVPATLGTVTGAGLGLPSIFAVTGGTCATGGSVAAAASCTITITYTPTSAVNSTVTMSLSYNDGVNGQIATRSIQGTGLTVGTLSISDGTTYNYGNIINTTVTGSTTPSHTFHVSNTGQSPVTLGTITTAGLGLAAPFTLAGSGSTCVTGGTVAGGANCTLDVLFAPITYTTSTGTITVNYTSGTAPTATRAIQGTGAHLAALALSTSPSTSPYHFGTVEITGSGTMEVTVTNVGSLSPSGTATLTDVSSSGLGLSSLFTVTGGTCATNDTIDALGTCTIDVSYAPTAAVFSSGSLTLPYNNGVAVASTSPALTFDGTGIFPGVLSISDGPGTYPFGTAYLGSVTPAASPMPNPSPTSRSKTFTVTNSGLSVTLLTVTTSGLGLSDPFALTGGTCANGTLATSGTCTLIVTYTPTDDSTGTTTQSLELNYFDRVNSQAASRGVSGIAKYVASLTVDESSYTPDENYYDFGLVVNPSTPTHTFTITNHGETNATLGTITTAGLGLATPFSRSGGTCATSGTLTPGSSCTIIVTFNTSTGTTYSDTMVVHYNDNAGDTNQTTEIEIRGQNYIPGVLTFSDGGSYNYGTIWTFNSISHTFTVTNTSAVSVTLASTVINGPNLGFNGVGSFNYNGGTCSANLVLAPNASCTIASYFTPYGASVYSDSISMGFSDGINSGTAGISLAGTGVSPGYLSQYYRFNDVAVGSSTAAYFLLTNSGGYPGLITSTLSSGGLSLDPPLSYVAGSCTTSTTYAVGDSCTLGILYTPTHPVVGSSQSLTVAITSTLNSVTPPTQTNNLNFTVGYGPSVTISPTSYNYPTGACSTNSHSFTVTNPTTANITLTGVDTSGGLGLDGTHFSLNSGSTTCTNGTLAPAATCTISVNGIFTSSSGAQANTLTVHYTDWSPKTVTTSLTLLDSCGV